MSEFNPNVYQNKYNPQITQSNQSQNVQQPNYTQTQVRQQIPVRIPAYYQGSDAFEPAKGLKETLATNPATSVLYEMVLKTPMEHPIITLLTWLGLGYGLDKYTQAIGGNYEGSLLQKIANAGDKLENSSLIQNKPMQKVLGGFSYAKNKVKNVAKNSALLRAMKDTPTKPEWAMVKSQMYSQEKEVIQDFIRIIDKLNLDNDKEFSFKHLGLNKSEKEMLKQVFNVDNLSKADEIKMSNQVLLKRIGKTQTEIDAINKLSKEESVKATKKALLDLMELNSEKIKKIKADDLIKEEEANVAKWVKDACQKANGKIKIGEGNYTWMGKLTKPFQRNIGCDDIYNRLHSMSSGAKTSTGRFLSKFTQMVHRGFTFGGGKLGALIFIAPALIEVAKNVKKANNDEKVGTAANGLVESVSWVFTFPLALKIMHSLGGVRYAGLDKDQVTEIRNKIKALKEQNAKGMTKEAYNKAKEEINNLLKGGKKLNFFSRMVKKVGSWMTMDLENIPKWNSGNIAGNTMRKIPNFFKNVAGVPARFIIWGLISMGVLGSALTKGTKMIFGKSYDPTKEEEQKEAMKAQKEFLKEDLQARLQQAAIQKQMAMISQAQQIKQAQDIQQPRQIQQVTQNNMMQTQMEKNSANFTNKANPQVVQENPTIIQDGNKIIVDKNQKVDNYSYIPNQQNVLLNSSNQQKKNKLDNYTYIPSSECTIKTDKQKENSRSYIPSQAAANIQKTFDTSGWQSAFDRAQRAEDNALKILAGNFDGM